MWMWYVGALLSPGEDDHVGVCEDGDAAANNYPHVFMHSFNSFVDLIDSSGGGGGGVLPVAPISPIATTRWARSAQMRPRSTMRSKVETWASLAWLAAPRRRATRCWGVSVGAAGAGAGEVRVKACGPVAVKRVASATERGGGIGRCGGGVGVWVCGGGAEAEAEGGWFYGGRWGDGKLTRKAITIEADDAGTATTNPGLGQFW